MVEKNEKINEIAKIKSKYDSNSSIESDDREAIQEKERETIVLESEIDTYKKLIHNYTVKGDIDFNDGSNYFVNSVDGKYKSIIDKKTLTNWKKPIYLEREEESKNRIKNTEQLEFKYHFIKQNLKSICSLHCFYKKGEIL